MFGTEQPMRSTTARLWQRPPRHCIRRLRPLAGPEAFLPRRLASVDAGRRLFPFGPWRDPTARCGHSGRR